MPPRVVPPPPGAGHDHTTLDVEERQVLQGYPADIFQYHARLLLLHISGALWIILTPTLDLYQEDFAGEDVVPLARAAQFPMNDRPYFTFEHLTEDTLNGLRRRAAGLAAILGVTAASIPATIGAGMRWIFADTSLAEFNQEVPDDLMQQGEPAVVIREGHALVSRVNPNDRAKRLWTVAEKVSDAERPAWVAEKREGAGRDPRLAAITFDSTKPRPLFREAIAGMNRMATADASIFSGPSATAELVGGLLQTGLEPPGYHASWERTSGVGPKSAICREHLHLWMLLWYLAVVDRLDVFANTSAEHVSRRILQIQKAVKKNPGSPDFTGLEVYGQHLIDAGGALPSSKFDAHVATTQKAEAFFMKQTRLAREEEAAATANKNKNNNNNKNGE